MDSNLDGAHSAPKARRKIPVPASERTVWNLADLRARYNKSAPTLWRWEKLGKIPPRDVFINGKPAAWRCETILTAERGVT